VVAQVEAAEGSAAAAREGERLAMLRAQVLVP